MKLTEHFSSEEFDQPKRHGFISIAYPSQWINERLMPLCEVLEIIRAQFNRPLRILSGYRSQQYNQFVGGQPHSQHMEGRAADITVDANDPGTVHRVVLNLYYDKKILIGGLGSYPGFTHVDIRPQTPSGHLAQWDGKRQS